MSDFLGQAFITLLVIIDPFMIVPIFMVLTKDYTALERKQTAKKTALISASLLAFFGIVGDKLLDALGISQAAFKITGGLLLFLAGLEMVMAHSSSARTLNVDEEKEVAKRHDISVFPLSIPLIAGPGSIASIVVLMREAENIGLKAQFGVILLAFLVILLTYCTMRLGATLMKFLGVTGMNVLTRVFGIIVAALATEYIISGLVTVLKSARTP